MPLREIPDLIERNLAPARWRTIISAGFVTTARVWVPFISANDCTFLSLALFLQEAVTVTRIYVGLREFNFPIPATCT